MKLCVTITERSHEGCIAALSTTEADLIEHRLDFMDSINGLSEVYSQTGGPIIATCRTVGNGGRFEGNEEERMNHLFNAISAGASYVDIEMEVEPKVRDLVRQRSNDAGCGFILSKHYHESTPSLIVLLKTVHTLSKADADIIKIVTTPTMLDDCIRVLQLYHTEDEAVPPLVSFAMGHLGMFTRVVALLLGAPFMYVAPDGGVAVAPGQIPLSQMRSCLEELL